MERIPSVDSVTIHILKSNPPQIAVSAIGKVPTSGWSNPALGAWFYIVAPKDGIQDFDFYADAPSGIVLPVVLPITAEVVVARDPKDYWGPGKPLIGVRIHARDNKAEALLDAKSTMVHDSPPIAGGLPLPWPFPWNKLHTAATFGGSDIPFPLSLQFCLSQLIGKTVRVFHTGDMITMDFRPDRLNLELSPTTQRIVHAFFG
jgi:Peptidase inhibitor I78 family